MVYGHMHRLKLSVTQVHITAAELYFAQGEIYEQAAAMYVHEHMLYNI